MGRQTGGNRGTHRGSTQGKITCQAFNTSPPHPTTSHYSQEPKSKQVHQLPTHFTCYATSIHHYLAPPTLAEWNSLPSPSRPHHLATILQPTTMANSSQPFTPPTLAKWIRQPPPHDSIYHTTTTCPQHMPPTLAEQSSQQPHRFDNPHHHFVPSTMAWRTRQLPHHATTTTSHLHPWLNNCTSSLPTLASSCCPHYQHDHCALCPHPLPWPDWFPHQHIVHSLAPSILRTHLPPKPIRFPGTQRWMDHEMAQNKAQIILDIDIILLSFYIHIFQLTFSHYLIFKYCLLSYPLYLYYTTLLSIYLHHSLILKFQIYFCFIHDFLILFQIFDFLFLFWFWFAFLFALEYSPTHRLSLDTHRQASLWGWAHVAVLVAVLGFLRLWVVFHVHTA